MVDLFGEENEEKVNLLNLHFKAGAPLEATAPCPTPAVLS